MRTPSRSRPNSFSRLAPLAAALAAALTAQGALAGAVGACPTATGPLAELCVVNTNPTGLGSLRAAVDFANLNCNTGQSPKIEFDIPGTGPFVINVSGGLAFNCSNPFNPTIDGSTQPGSSPNTSSNGFNAVNQIVLTGGGNTFSGLELNSGFAYGGALTVKGIDFTDFYFTSYAGPCSGSSTPAVSGPVVAVGNRFTNSCYGIDFWEVDTDGTFVAGGEGPSTIGGPSLADRNAFGGNFLAAIINTSYGGSANIRGNFIGTLDGVTSGGGTAKGLSLVGDGPKTVQDNVISGNAGPAGIYLQIATNTTITNNKIGPAVNGTTLGNAQDGIFATSTYDVQITNNTIAFNGRDGVNVSSGQGVEIRDNSIFGNARKAINLGDVATQVPNDPADTDSGPNDLQNFPVITSVFKNAAANQTTINWQLESTSGTSFDIEFFSNPMGTAAPQATTLLGLIAASTGAASNFTLGSTNFPGLHDFISATATDAGLGNTSEVGAMALAKGLDLSPTSHDFGNVVVNSASPTVAATLTSIGASPFHINLLHGSALCYGGPAPICAASQFTCATTCVTGQPYSMGTSCSISASFNPISLGPANTTIYICDDAGGNPRTLTLVGNAVAPPPPTILPPSHDFGAVEIGTFSAPHAFTVTNPSPTAITLTAFAVTAPFQVVANTCGAALAASTSCTLTARYGPLAAGLSTGTVSSTASTGPLSAALSGTGTAGPPPTLTPPSVNFGAVTLGTSSGPATFTLHNPAATSIALSSFTVAAPFALAGTTCTATLAAGASCTAAALFSPLAIGGATGSIQVTAGGIVFSSSLTGTGSSLATLQITPVAHDFGSVLVGFVSPARSFSIHNPSTISMPLDPLTVSGPFRIASTTCAASLAGLSSCGADVQFLPTAAGPAAGSLAATSTSAATATKSSAIASLTGNGIREPGVTLSGSNIEFGSMVVGSAPVSQTIQLNNPGNATLGINSITVNSPFTVSHTCGVSLSPGDTCNITTGFNPTVIGDFGAFLGISTNAPGGTFLQVSVHAAVQARPEPLVRVSPRVINFGARFAGSPSPTQNITVVNEGGAVASLNVALGVPNFLIVNTNCGATLAPGASCGVELGFSPQGFGPKQGELLVSSNSPDSPQSVSLSGAGCRPPAITQSRGATSLNCSP